MRSDRIKRADELDKAALQAQTLAEAQRLSELASQLRKLDSEPAARRPMLTAVFRN